MNVAIFGSYSYWNDGISWADFAERGSLKEVVDAASERWFTYKEKMVIDDAIGVDLEEIRLLITSRYNQLINDETLKRRIDTLKVSIRHCEQWLSNRDAETIRLTKLLADNQSELKDLLNDNGI